MPDQQINREFDDIELIRERLRNAKGGRKKIGSIASLVDVLRDDIEVQRARGLSWRAIAEAIVKDEAKQAAVRSAYQRLPSAAAKRGGEAPPRKTRTKSEPPPPKQEAEEHQPPATNTRFDLTPMTDGYGSDNNN